MKLKYLVILLAPIFMIGCAKEEVKETAEEVGHSRITYFPTFTMGGDTYLSIVKGGTYTEAGVTAKEGDKDLQVTTTGSVDVNTVGIYNLVYSAVNKDGFAGSVTRTIAVLPEAEQPGVDISGNYKNTGSFNYTAKISKLAPGFYITDNIWGGGSAAVIASYIITTNGTDLLLPLNSISPYGNVKGTGTLDNAGNLTYVVSLLDFGVNNSTRKWKKV